jgi:hypothetical protein
MKEFRATSGPFDRQLRFSCEEIDQMCRDALAKEKLLPNEPEPIRIDRFVEKYFKCQISYEDLGQGILGCTVFNANGSVKVVAISTHINDGTPVGERRMRATIAHEGGHGLMHPSLFMTSLEQGRLSFVQTNKENLDFKERRILCRDNDVKEDVARQRGYDGRWWEWQANRAIGGLLLPQHLVKKSVDELLERSSVMGVPELSPGRRAEAARRVAEVFNVNPAVARIRLGEIFPDAGGQLTF